MEKQIYNAIKESNQFDGTNYERFLTEPITITYDGEVEEIVRVLIADNMVVAHLLNENDDSKFVNFNCLDNNTQTKIYKDICRNIKMMNIDEFFDKMKNFLVDGDKLIVKYEQMEDGEDDYDNFVYSIYNSCDDIIGEYHTLTNVYKSF